MIYLAVEKLYVFAILNRVWRGVRVVEGAALEKRCGVKPTESSNLFLSANKNTVQTGCLFISSYSNVWRSFVKSPFNADEFDVSVVTKPLSRGAAISRTM